jgi:hypothetical protein
VNVGGCQVEVSASGWSLVQRSPTECGVCEWNRDCSMRRPWPTGGCCGMVKEIVNAGCFPVIVTVLKFNI